MRNATGEVDSLEQRHSKQERQLKSIGKRLDRSRAAESSQEEIDDMAIRFGEEDPKKIQVRMSRETGSVVLLRVHRVYVGSPGPAGDPAVTVGDLRVTLPEVNSPNTRCIGGSGSCRPFKERGSGHPLF
jgi:hypothetical protein